MKNIIIKDEGNYQVVAGNAISLLSNLPASIYELKYEPKQGFVLNESENNFKITKKIYGDIETITKRVFLTFEKRNKNLGILLSGAKGMGKTLALCNICSEAIKKGLPVIMVKENYDGLSSFIELICQPVVVVFDEFEKIYQNRSKRERDELDGQDSLLNLFDSAFNGKKLFLLTCNNDISLSEYLLNRPGRIHYHFRMHRLSIKEITEYCNDNLKNENHSLIPDICSIGARIPDFSYDILGAIIFELNNYQCGLGEIQEILNIDFGSK